MFSSSLFPDDILATAEQDIAKFESAPSAQGPGPGTGQHSGRKHQSYRYKPYDKKDNRQSGHSSSQSSQPWRQFVEGAVPVISPDRPVNNHINDNYCLIDPQLDLSVEDRMCQDLNKTVNFHVVGHAPCVTGLWENKDIRPDQTQTEIKCVKPVSCVNLCPCVPNVQNVPHAVKDPPVGARLQRFWQVWHSLGANPRVVSILQEGYHLHFKEKPPLSRSPVIINGYANPVKSKHLKDSLQALIQKQAVEKVTNPSSLAFWYQN